MLLEQTSRALSAFEQHAINALKDEFGELRRDISNRRNEISPRSRFKNALKDFKISSSQFKVISQAYILGEASICGHPPPD